ncbi:MAG: vitamin B12 dependent-methionine synthase activation domain-containing protein, partial [Spirochaetaceae bacterium]|nr:vitamin B12 dependent-methionine synthase activation domain-containing protein [Spirochaetaceae bacterium]
SWRAAAPEERLAHALVKGIEEHIADDVREIRARYPSALAVIEGPLMAGMSKVGELFAAGRMFLPQVIKSARAMKRAVAYLEPWLIEERAAAAGGSSSAAPRERGAGKILMATVKGDVHDIGKSIVGVVLACNGFEIVDLGVMVARDAILDAAEKESADLVAISGLIAPSLEEMRDIARGMQARKMTVPLMIGGATTSAAHTAVRIAPEYGGLVVHARDASAAAGIARSLLSPEKKTPFIAETKREQERLRVAWERGEGKARPLPLAEARSRRIAIDWKGARISEPRHAGLHVFGDYPIEELEPYIDWSFLLLAWDVPGRYPDVLGDPVRGPEARRLVDDGRALLAELVAGKRLRASGAFGLWPANSRGDDIVLWTGADRKAELARFPFLRSQTPEEGGSCPCLSDFVAPEGSGMLDYIGAFAVTAGLGSEEVARSYRRSGDDYKAIMSGTLADRLAEAFAERLHEEVRRRFWGYEPVGAATRGIRPSPGFPACPIHSDKTTILDLLDAERMIGIGLTESWMMTPAASVCGFYFAAEAARYFDVGPIAADQRQDWANRAGLAPAEAEKALRAVAGSRL